MGQMIPNLSEQQLGQLGSAAEAKVYRAFRDLLPGEYVVLSPVRWILRKEDNQARDGEADFSGRPSKSMAIFVLRSKVVV